MVLLLVNNSVLNTSIVETDPIVCSLAMGDQKVYFYFFKRPERYNKEVLSHSFICLPLPHMKGIILCVTQIFIV